MGTFYQQRTWEGSVSAEATTLISEKEQIDACLVQPVLARLATANPITGQPHVVPVWYLWDGESIWISAFRSTRKVKELQKNPLCSIVIDDSSSGTENWGVVMEGYADLITEPQVFLEEMTTRIYTRYLGEDGVLEDDPQSWIKDAENLLIKLTPEKTYSWFA
jgi:nitroimidazol reductase NimA-like FMN-containing flavoprotein (pyridoxamine 5'-phosphate oxidase superfamily)